MIPKFLLITVVCCLVSFSLGEAVRAVDQWYKTYTMVFGPSAKPLSDSKMMLLLMGLESNARSLDGMVHKHLVGRVRYWLDVLNNVEPGHCDIAYIGHLREAYDQHKERGNDQRLIEFAQRTILKKCSDYHLELGTKLDAILHDQMPSVRKIYTSFDYYFSTEQELWYYVPLARKIAGVSGFASKDKLIEGWRNGFCRKIQAEMDKQHMVYHARFIEFVTKLGHSQMEYVAEPVQGWVKIVDMCNQLDCIVRNYVHKGSCEPKTHVVE